MFILQDIKIKISINYIKKFYYKIDICLPLICISKSQIYKTNIFNNKKHLARFKLQDAFCFTAKDLIIKNNP